MEKIMIDKSLAEAIRIALRDFGEGILDEERLMGVLKDYQGFQTLPAGLYIVREMIKNHTVSRLLVVSRKGEQEIGDFLYAEVNRYATSHGFSEDKLRKVLLSLLSGIRTDYYYTNFNSLKEEVSTKEVNKPTDFRGNLGPEPSNQKEEERVCGQDDPNHNSAHGQSQSSGTHNNSSSGKQASSKGSNNGVGVPSGLNANTNASGNSSPQPKAKNNNILNGILFGSIIFVPFFVIPMGVIQYAKYHAEMKRKWRMKSTSVRPIEKENTINIPPVDTMPSSSQPPRRHPKTYVPDAEPDYEEVYYDNKYPVSPDDPYAHKYLEPVHESDRYVEPDFGADGLDHDEDGDYDDNDDDIDDYTDE